MRTRGMELLHPQQILNEIQHCPVTYWPVGPLEWRRPHLPTGTDALNAEAVASMAAEKSGGLVLPTFYWGTEQERSPEMLKCLVFAGDEWVVGMDFPANGLLSMCISEEIFALVVRQHLHLITNLGFKIIVILTGHAAENQMQVLERLSAQFNVDGQTDGLVAMPFVASDEGVLEIGHASRIEISAMIAFSAPLLNGDRKI